MMISWVNYQLIRGGHSEIRSLEELWDGLALRNLLEVLMKKKVMGRINENPKLPVQRVSNLNLCFSAMAKEKVK
jgi:hypothetical protein